VVQYHFTARMRAVPAEETVMAKDTDESPFAKKLDEKAAETVFSVVWGCVEGLKNMAWHKAAVRTATEKYSSSYSERHGIVHILNMSRPIPLHEIYTAVRVVSREHLGAFVNQDDMERQFRDGGRRLPAYRDDQSEDGIVVANREQFLNLLGAPGSGKSTFLRRLGQEAMLARTPAERIDPTVAGSGGKYDHQLLPVYLELRLFKSGDIDLVGRIAEEFSYAGFPEDRKFAETALASGKLLILLDGLDEVATDRLGEVIDHIKGFVDTHADAGNRFVTSCRTAHYKSAFPRFVDLVLADFSDDQIRRFSSNWFRGLQHRQEETAKGFIEVLYDPANHAALELARTPLLLTFLCLTYEYGQDLPPSRAALYRRALELLLREWAAARRVHDEPVYRELNADLELDLLAEFAEELFREDRFFFNRKRVTDHIRAFMELQLSAPKSLDAGKILEAIEVQQGLIVRRADDMYSFSHLTIQEFLTAKSMWDRGDVVWRPAVRENAGDPRWEVVIEVMAGMGKADALLRAVAETGRECLESWVRKLPQARDALAWLPPDPRERSSQSRAAGRLLSLAVDLATDYLHQLDRLDTDGHVKDYHFHQVRQVATFVAITCAWEIDGSQTIPVSPAGSFLAHASRAHDSARTLAQSRTRTLKLIELLQDVRRTDFEFELNRPPFSFGAEETPLYEKVISHLRIVQLLDSVRCAAYSLRGDTWDEVCDSILQLPPKIEPQQD
jgi:hypothetical protein